MSVPPAEKNITRWFICIPWPFKSSKRRRLGFSSYVWTKPKQRLGRSSGIGFAADHFEVRLLVFPLPHIATVNADRQRRLGTRQCCPLPGAALNETYPFIAQGCFCSFSDPVQVIAYTGRIERFSYRQRVLEQVRGQFKGDQRSPLGLQIQSFGRYMLI